MKILDLYITDVCNLSCEYCYVDVVKKEETHFDREAFTQRIDLLAYDSIKFLGGEPLIRWEDIKNIIESVSQKKPDTNFTIISNGILLSEEKINFLSQYSNVEILISLHDGSRNIIKKNISLLKRLANNISFYIIFDPNNFYDSISKFLEFSQQGFKNFCFAPEIYAHWNDENLQQLQKILSGLSEFIMKHHISIGGISKNTLKVMNYGCEKTVFNKLGKHQPCNRFRALEEDEGFNYKKVYDYFHEKTGYRDDPNRWFYVCPVGWFLDNKHDLEEKTRSYVRLNSIFLDFHRTINAESINFLNPHISEIRFNLTRQCNIRCEYCYVDFKNESLPFQEAKNIIDFFIEQDGEHKTFSFFGGEPLLEKSLLLKLVEYIHTKNRQYNKNISFKIATNFMLVDDEIIHLLTENNFEIHISLNGDVSVNNKMRDNSTQRVIKNIQKYSSDLSPQKLVILLAFSPNEISMLGQSLAFITSLGFYRVNFELVFGENISWKKTDLLRAVKNIFIFGKQIDIQIENIKTHKNIFLDIDTKGRSNDNSLEFYGKQVDSESKIYFDTILTKIFTHVGEKAL